MSEVEKLFEEFKGRLVEVECECDDEKRAKCVMYPEYCDGTRKEVIDLVQLIDEGLNNKLLADKDTRIEELENEKNLTKSLLYCTKRTCDNCGFVNCENFQRQRKSEPCALYISYQDRIKNLTNESDVLRESFNNSEMNLSFVSEQLTKAKDLISNLLRVTYGEGWNYSLDVKVKAEDFLKENNNEQART